jgi:hypothetical protein
MKKTFITTITCAATVAFAAPAAKAASYTVFSGDPVNLVNAFSDVNFSIPQFDPALGTLTGVTVRVLQSNLTGSFIVTNNGLNATNVEGLRSSLGVRPVTTDLGYDLTTKTIEPGLTSSNSDSSTTINPAESVTFFITETIHTFDDRSISSVNFSAYEGAGNVIFGIQNQFTVFIGGGNFTLDSTNTSTTTQMGITYTYEAIPETSSALLGGIGMLLLLRRRRIG